MQIAQLCRKQKLIKNVIIHNIRKNLDIDLIYRLQSHGINQYFFIQTDVWLNWDINSCHLITYVDLNISEIQLQQGTVLKSVNLWGSWCSLDP